MMAFEKLFCAKNASGETPESIDGIIDVLRSKIDWLHSLPVDEIIRFLDAASKKMVYDKKLTKKIGGDVKYLSNFLMKENLEEILDTALRGDRKVLDGFVRLNKKNTLFHAQPRGLAVHWIAGNVATLGVFSIIQSLITKNTSLVKASSASNSELVEILEFLRKVETPKINGLQLLDTVAVILVDRRAGQLHEKISLAADIRVAWGGQKAIDTIINLRKRFGTEDIIYGPKYSYAVIDKKSLASSFSELAQKLAMDASVFDQYACSSPHTIFVEIGGKKTPKDFAQELAKKMDLINRVMIPKKVETTDKAMEIHRIRGEYDFKGNVFASKNTDWTVVFSEETGLAKPCFSRVVFVRPVESIYDVVYYGDRHKQAIGLAVSPEKKMDFVDKSTLYGVDRCPAPGTMSNFTSPWDGVFGIERMVRWITTYA